MTVIIDGRTLDKVRGKIKDQVNVGRRGLNCLACYNSWSEYIDEMEILDKYADIHFVYNLSAVYNVAVHITSNILDEPQVYYLGFLEPTDSNTVVF